MRHEKLDFKKLDLHLDDPVSLKNINIVMVFAVIVLLLVCAYTYFAG